MVDFHGWEMPIRYDQIPAEHLKVRESAGLFDLGHMGRLELRGPDTVSWVDHLVTSDIASLEVGGARYGLVCAPDGGIIDDVIAYRLPDRIFLVVNASNRETVVRWFEEHREGRDAKLADRTLEMAMVSIQGPRAVEVVAPLIEDLPTSLEEMPYYRIAPARVLGEDSLVATTGYTGEHGVEIYAPGDLAIGLWDGILQSGGELVAPIGLGARDTLRVEAGMPLYGNEIDRDVNPFEAGLGFAVALEKGAAFVGRDALARVRDEGPRRKLVGLRIESRKIARSGMTLSQGGRDIGKVTSGIPSPSLGVPIALALIDADVRQADGIEVDIRGTRFPAVPEPLPFVSRTRKKRKRAL